MNFPLIGKPFADHDPHSFREYIRSLFLAPAEKKKAKDFAIRFNDQGNPVITVRRKPKWVSRVEIEELSKDLKIDERLVWIWLAQRNIQVRDSETIVRIG